MFINYQIKKFDLKKIEDIILMCRKLGVLELRLDKMQVRLSSDLNSDIKTPINIEVKEQQIPSQSPLKNEKRRPVTDDELICSDPSAYMRKLERGEINFDKDFGDGAGEEI